MSPGETAGRILVVEDDPEAASFIIQVLGVRGDFDVTHTADPVAALLRASTEPWDLVLTDVEMPGMTGIELLESLRRVAPELPVAIMTAYASVGNAIGALRSRADEFLEKPLRPALLTDTVSRLVAKGRAERRLRREMVLAIGAHPDDAEVGVGGTLAACHQMGHQVAILTLSRAARGGGEQERAGEYWSRFGDGRFAEAFEVIRDGVAVKSGQSAGHPAGILADELTMPALSAAAEPPAMAGDPDDPG